MLLKLGLSRGLLKVKENFTKKSQANLWFNGQLLWVLSMV